MNKINKCFTIFIMSRNCRSGCSESKKFKYSHYINIIRGNFMSKNKQEIKMLKINDIEKLKDIILDLIDQDFIIIKMSHKKINSFLKEISTEEPVELIKDKKTKYFLTKIKIKNDRYYVVQFADLLPALKSEGSNSR